MQIYELTKKQPLNEVDIVGPGGLLNKIGAAGKALMQPGGVKDAVRTITPGAKQGATSTYDLTHSDFAKRMQAVKNSAATKQVAANLQQQWNQYKTTIAPMTQITTAQQAQQQGLKSQLLAKKVSGAPKPAKLPLPESQQLTEAPGVIQLTNWYKQSVIPKSMAAASAKYLANPAIQTALKKIISSDNNPGEQSKAFVDLVAATRAESQEISAKNSPVAAAAAGGASKAAKPLASGTQAAQTNISKAAGISPSQLAAIEKITGALPPVSSRDPNTTAYLRALGFDIQ